MSWGTKLIGYTSVLETLEDLRVQFEGDTTYLVGPTVEYAVYVDQGTVKMDARPFVKPAAERVQADLRSKIDPHLQGDPEDAQESELVRATALAIEAEMKRIITQKGAVDTGAMRASVSIEKV